MPPVSLPRVNLTDRTGVLGATGAAVAGLPPAAIYGYLLARLLIPILLICTPVARRPPVSASAWSATTCSGAPRGPTAPRGSPEATQPVPRQVQDLAVGGVRLRAGVWIAGCARERCGAGKEPAVRG
jgi:hypothetical protein